MKINNYSKNNFLNSFFGIGILILFFSCNNTIPPNQMEVTGIVQPQQMTTYQYGSHTISGEGNIFYAITSESVDLDKYIGEEITIIAKKIAGYPVDGGPEYLRVLEIKK